MKKAMKRFIEFLIHCFLKGYHLHKSPPKGRKKEKEQQEVPCEHQWEAIDLEHSRCIKCDLITGL